VTRARASTPPAPVDHETEDADEQQYGSLIGRRRAICAGCATRPACTNVSGSSALAFCDMSTLYLRNVPDDVGRQLAALAAREGISVSAFAVRELAEAARRADNRALLGDLPDLGVSAATVVADVEAARGER